MKETIKLENVYENLSKEELIALAEQQRLELIQKEAVCKEYKKHLEQVIKRVSVEKYILTVKKNRDALKMNYPARWWFDLSPLSLLSTSSRVFANAKTERDQ